jgi:hypothetical protein
MDMKERLRELIMELDPEIRHIVAEVVALERENLDLRSPQIKGKIRDIVDKYARQGIGNDET